MKLYYFNPNTYGKEAFVCAESKEQAIEFLRSTKIEPITTYKDKEFEAEMNERNQRFYEEKINSMINCKNKYSIDEFEPGQVVFSEIC